MSFWIVAMGFVRGEAESIRRVALRAKSDGSEALRGTEASRSSGRRTTKGSLSRRRRWRGGAQGEVAQHVVGEGEQQERSTRLFFAAQEQTAQPHAARPRVWALGPGALFVKRLTVWARHAPPPIGDARTVVVASGEGVRAVLVLGRRTGQPDVASVRPFDVVVLGEAAVDQVILRLNPDLAQPLQRPSGPDRDPSRLSRRRLRR